MYREQEKGDEKNRESQEAQGIFKLSGAEIAPFKGDICTSVQAFEADEGARLLDI